MLVAVYSRKSKWTGRGESVENQVIMCKEYIEKFIENARDAEIIVYEDEGYSGKNTKRPEFQKMIADMKKRHYDYLVCYKLDRLGRNIADLAMLIEELKQWETDFISIKEKFDTSTPMGKAMLYFSGVLAQMEREQIAERVRDNMVMLARDGRWLGGNTPLGFGTMEEKKVTVNGKSKKSFRLKQNPEEIEFVKFIFQEYLKKQSLAKVVEYFLKHDIKTKRGKDYTIMAIRDILTNPVYCTGDEEAYEYFWNLGCQVCFDKEELDGRKGLMSYAKTSSAKYKNKENPPEKWIISQGIHEGVISGKDFVKVQKLLEINKHKGDSYRKVQNEIALLSGILYCSCGHAMRPKYYSADQRDEQGNRKFSYLCPYKDKTHGEKCSVVNVQGNTIDRLVCEEVLRYTEETSDIQRMLLKLKERISDCEENKVTENDILQKQIQEKREEIKNLISSLGKSNGNDLFVQEIEKQVEKLNQDCLRMEKLLKEEEDSTYIMNGTEMQIEVLMGKLSSFRELFDTLTVPEKREYLRIILDKVVWDGKNVHIFIYGSH